MFAIALDVNEDNHLDIVAGGKNADAKVAWFEQYLENLQAYLRGEEVAFGIG